ncbi:putative lipid II flippase FtsW [Candidatus Amesbacteria bacterium]|nr:putative lipid II flippase FtsW [Candidatus Amesbacteria bacterium]
MRTGYWLLILTFILVGFGVIMVGNASFVDAATDFGNKWYYLRFQALWAVLGSIALFVSLKFPLSRLEKLGQIMILSCLGMLVLVLIPGIGTKLLGARRWIGIGFASFQPAELTKLVVIIYLARLFTKSDFQVKYFIYVVFGVLGLVMLEPDMGTAIIIFLVSMTMYFMSGHTLKLFYWLVPISVIAGIILILVFPYRFDRLKSFLDVSSDPQGNSYHIRQALLGIGSGGIWGVGFGQSKQKYQFLPEVTTDSIFAVFAEEMGLVGGITLIGTFMTLIYLGLKTSQNAKNKFESLVAVGISSWVGWQFIINIAAMTALVPLTGIPLPFISYGGSSLIFLMSGMGLLINVARNSS